MNLRHFHIITITHQNLAVEELKHFILSDAQDRSVSLADMKDNFGFEELMYLNTCNRVSYIFVSKDHIDHNWNAKFISWINPELPEKILAKLPKFIDHYAGSDAIRHLCKVASSVDSMVVGEREIFRQFRTAYDRSRELGHTGDFLRLVEKHIVSVAKKIYTDTKIGERPVSVASLTFQKILESQLKPEGKILLIGAGETNRNIAKFLHKHNFNNVIVFNRSLNNTGEITNLLDTEAFHLSDLQNYKEGFEGIIICTASTKPIIDIQTYKQLVGRDTNPKTVVDLSVPRNIDDEVVKNYPINYINIEGIRSLAEANLAFRKNEMLQALEIIEDEAESFENMIQLRKMEKALTSLPDAIKEVKHLALESVFQKKLESLDGESRSLVLEMMDYMEKKCVAIPMKMAKESVMED